MLAILFQEQLDKASPFLVFLGGGYLSHLPAAAFGALVVYSALRARDEGGGWACLTGAACGGLVACRPWLGLVLGIGLPVGLWTGAAIRKRGLPWLTARFGGATLGGIAAHLEWGSSPGVRWTRCAAATGSVRPRQAPDRGVPAVPYQRERHRR